MPTSHTLQTHTQNTLQTHTQNTLQTHTQNTLQTHTHKIHFRHTHKILLLNLSTDYFKFCDSDFSVVITFSFVGHECLRDFAQHSCGAKGTAMTVPLRLKELCWHFLEGFLKDCYYIFNILLILLCVNLTLWLIFLSIDFWVCLISRSRHQRQEMRVVCVNNCIASPVICFIFFVCVCVLNSFLVYRMSFVSVKACFLFYNCHQKYGTPKPRFPCPFQDFCVHVSRSTLSAFFVLFVCPPRTDSGYYVTCRQTHEMCVLLEMSVTWVGKNKRLVEFCWWYCLEMSHSPASRSCLSILPPTPITSPSLHTCCLQPRLLSMNADTFIPATVRELEILHHILSVWSKVQSWFCCQWKKQQKSKINGFFEIQMFIPCPPSVNIVGTQHTDRFHAFAEF